MFSKCRQLELIYALVSFFSLSLFFKYAVYRNDTNFSTVPLICRENWWKFIHVRIKVREFLFPPHPPVARSPTVSFSRLRKLFLMFPSLRRKLFKTSTIIFLNAARIKLNYRMKYSATNKHRRSFFFDHRIGSTWQWIILPFFFPFFLWYIC